jgi:hypothetical protein
MNTTKTLMLAAVTALALGVGNAMAQESAGGVGFGPYETEQLNKLLARQAANSHNVAASSHAPQYGSSDLTNATRWPTPVPQGGDGNGG